MKRLEGKFAIVTGASGELGSAIVEAFLEEGAVVAAVCHTREGRLMELACPELYIYHMDVCDRESVQEICGQMVRELGEPDILVNNAGISDSALFFAMNESSWDKVLKTNLYI